MLLYIQYAEFCRQQKGRGFEPRHTRRKKGIPTANPSDVSEGAVLLAYIYSIPDFLASANFYRIFLPAMDGGGMTRDFVLLAEFLPAIFAKKRSCAYFAQPGDALRKSLFFHKYSLTQNMSNYKWKVVSDTFSISYFLQNTTAKPQKLPAAYKKTGRNKCSL